MSIRPGSEGGLTLDLDVGQDRMPSAAGSAGVGGPTVCGADRAELRCKFSFTPSISRDKLSKLESSRSLIISVTSLAVRVNGDLQRYSSRAREDSPPVWQPEFVLSPTTRFQAGSATGEFVQSDQWPIRCPAVAHSGAQPCVRSP